MSSEREAVRAWAVTDATGVIVPELIARDEDEAKHSAWTLNLGGPVPVEIRPLPHDKEVEG